MKKIFFFLTTFILFSINMNAQKSSYDKQWQAIDTLIYKQDLQKQALQKVMALGQQAKTEKNDPQYIKSLIYQTYLQQRLSEEDRSENIALYQKAIAEASEPAKSIVQSLLAEEYWRIYQYDKWKIYQRTTTTNAPSNDVNTWTVKDFHQKMSALFLASVHNANILQKTSIKEINAIIRNGNTDELRPTVYDLLAHRALTYFSTSDAYLTQPSDAFTINQNEAFVPASVFVKYNFSTTDSSSLLHHAVQLYQQVIQYHLSNNNKEALLDADLSRLSFMHQHSTQQNKDDLYETTLKQIIQEYATVNNVAEAYAMLATLYGDKANTYNPFGDSTYRWYYVKAKELCEKAIKTYKPSYGRSNCEGILTTIKRPATSLQIEMVNIPQQPFRALLTYHNISNINCRLIRIEANSSYKNINGYDTIVWKKLLKEKPLKQWQQAIPNPLDYQQHKTEIPIEGLSEGNYILVTSINNQFNNDENNKITATAFYVSNISYIRNRNDFFILNRNTGEPLTNASVQVYQQYYNYKTYKYETKKGPLLFADQQGHINVPSNTDEERSITLDIRYKNDRLFLNNSEYLSQSISYEYSVYEQMCFFTDRSIYRPGQTIYFKGLLLTKNINTEPAKISTNKEVTINLQNANGEIKGTLQLTTNAYGSVNGQFTIPQGSLAGQWYLNCANISSSRNYFSVEEYKRPSFYIGFDKPTKPYKLNDSVTIKGNAMAYAGYALSNAKVKYSISRESRFFYPWYEEWYGYYPNSGKQQITDGNIETEADGSFKINFKAMADKINAATRSQLFTFTIEVDITDLSGETHHQSFALPLSQQALQIDIPIANKSILTADSLSHVMLSTKNLWGEPQVSNIKVELIPIKETNRLLRQRYWDRPDQFTLSYDQYIQQFPNDIYNNENEPIAWAKQKSVYEEIIKSAQKLNKLSTISPGWYLLKTSTKDTFNNKVENQIYVQVYDPNAKQLPTTTYWWQPQQNITLNVNNTLRLLQGSSAENINLINLNIDNLKLNQNSIPFTYSTLSNNIQTITKSITTENQGGMIFSQAFVKHNRFYNSKTYITVPYQNTDLDIQYKTFRDKIEPGSKETWTVQIKTDKGNNTNAEVLTSMYDASLDQFIPHQWSTPNVWPRIYENRYWSAEAGFNTLYSIQKYIPETSIPYFSKIYSTIFSFNGFFNGYINSNYLGRDYYYGTRLKDGAFEINSSSGGISREMAPAPPTMAKMDGAKKVPGTVTEEKNKGDLDNKTPEQKQYNGGGDNSTITLRKNFNETAFFYPNLYTDNNGMVQFSFTIPEALTRWKWQVFAHNKDLATAVAEKNIITQKTLMVQPNWPRFMREGDKVELAIKVVNVSANEMKGQASLQLLDASTLQPVDIAFHNTTSNQNFTATAQQSTVVHFSFDLPYNYNKPLILRAIAKSDKYSDGEEVMLPILSSRILVTESVPLNMRKFGEKNFTLPTLLKMNQSSTLTPLNVSVEFSTNPVWYALQALPYLIEYPHECAEQTFNRLYAHAVASSIVRQNPNIAKVLQQWSKDSSALMSNLQKNQELKSILLEETPWIKDAADETTQKKWIAQLVDTMHATQEVLRIISQLQQLQSSNGGFMWFKGGPDDPYITQYILTGISRLNRMKAIPEAAQQALDEITKEALQYADYRIVEYVNELKKQKVKEDIFDPLAIQYLYMRSGFQDIPMDNKTKIAHKYLLDNATKYWKNYNLFGRGQLAIALFRNNKTKEATNILASAKDNSINNEEMGMYWKENIYGYYWYQSPIETQAILIEAFQEIEKNNATVNDLKTWLLQQKQTQRWPTTVSTADACYALLLSGSNWLTQQQTATISLGNTVLNSNEQKTEAGTGYFKKSFSADNIKSDMGNIKLTLSSPNGGGQVGAAPAWGGVYWQYLEDMNKIPVVGNGLQIKKQLYKEIITKSGKQLQPITKESTVKVGDKIIVRLEMHSDRNLEYVHLKDLRASNTEPLNVLSQYKYQDGLGYYESTKDIGTNFFFNYLPKGTYVFEYPLFVNHAGSYSTGVATMQCMYAPVFNSHSDAFVLKAKY